MIPLPEPFGEMQYCRPSGLWGRLSGYTADQLRAYGEAVQAEEREKWAGERLWLQSQLEAAIRAQNAITG